MNNTKSLLKRLLLLKLVCLPFLVYGQSFTPLNSGDFLGGMMPLPINEAMLAYVDIDGDGDLDVLSSGKFGNNLNDIAFQIITNELDGLGLFIVTTPSTTLIEPLFDGIIVPGDYNGDGHTDFFMAGTNSQNNPSAQLYRNTGVGGFVKDNTYGTDLPDLESPSAVWGDYDNDGDLDLVYAGATGNVTELNIYRNTGFKFVKDGVAEGSLLGAGLAGGSMDLGDYNLDGRLDLVITGYQSLSPSTPISRVYTNMGGGIFQAFIQANLTDLNNGSVKWGDFDADGMLDILLCGNDAGTPTAHVYRNTGAGFSLYYSGFAGVQNGNATWADYNNDGFLDVVVAGNGSGVNLVAEVYLFNNGGGTFTNDATANLTGIGNGSDLIFGDFNNDLVPDLILVGDTSGMNRSVVFYERSNFGSGSVPSTPSIVSDVPTGNNVLLDWLPLGGNDSLEYTYNLYLTLDGSSDTLDPAMASVPGGMREVAHFGRLKGSQVQLEGLPPGVYNWSVQAIGNNLIGSPFAGADSFEIISNSPSFAVFSDETNTSFGGSLPTGIKDGKVTPVDYDNDGDLDLFLIGNSNLSGITVEVELWQNNGSGNFSEDPSAINNVPGLYFSDAAWGDLNNDGALDLAICGRSAGGLRVTRIFVNDGNGNMNPGGGLVENPVEDVQSGSVDWGDFDNDGDLDLLLTGDASAGKVLHIYRNLFNENNQAAFDNEISLSNWAVSNGDAKFGDFDRDGDLDIVVTGEGSSGALTQILENDGNGNYSIANISGAPLLDLLNSSVDWADLNNDGFLDLVLTGSNGAPVEVLFTQIYFYQEFTFGQNTFRLLSIPNEILPGIKDGDAIFGDYDDDGDVDMLLTGEDAAGDPLSQLYFQSGLTGLNAPIYELSTFDSNVFLDIRSGSSAAWADFTGDQKLDLVLAGEQDGGTNSLEVKLYENTDANPNAIPNKPKNLNAILSGYEMILEWDQPDPPSGLSPNVVNGYTYNIWVDTLPNPEYISPPHADTMSGFRRVVHRGELDGNLRLVLEDLDEGTYYWSVQAVDQDFEGSVFANPQSFEYEDPTFIADTTVQLWPSQLPDGLKKASLKWADYDRNGFLDLFAIGQPDGGFYQTSIYVQDANGITKDVLNSSVLEDVREGSIDLGDVDNDGDLDVLLSGIGASGPICRIYNNIEDPDSVGAAYSISDTIEFPGVVGGAAKFGDFNNDGRLDVAIVGNDGVEGYSAIYKNLGVQGGNIAFENTGLNLAKLSEADLDWGDINQDGWLDLVMQGENNGMSLVRRVYVNDQSGGFTSFTLSGGGLKKGSIEFGDYDSDGFLDILSVGDNGTTGQSEVFRNNQNGTFSSAFSLEGIENGKANWGDYNNDGYKDIILTGQNGATINDLIVKLYRYDPIGNSFIDEYNAAAAFLPLGQGGAVSWGDFTGDGKLDVALAGGEGISGDVSLLLYENIDPNPDAVPAAPTQLKATVVGSEVILTWSPSAFNLPQNGLSYNVAIGSGMGGLDMTSPMADTLNGARYIVASGKVNDTTSWRIRNMPEGDYCFQVQAITADYQGSPFAKKCFRYEVPTFAHDTDTLFSVLPEGLRNSTLSWVDYDNDNDLDVLVMGELSSNMPYTRLFENQGTNSFDSVAVGMAQLAEGCISLVDINTDQLTDVVLSGRNQAGDPVTVFYRNDGAGIFTAVVTGLDSLYQSDMDWGDYDYDGDEDLIIQGNDGQMGHTRLYKNNGNLNFEEINTTLPDFKDGTADWFDFNGDGFLDILLTGEDTSGNSEVRLFENDGNGSFTFIPTTLPPLRRSSVSIGDCDNDGDEDLALMGLQGASTLIGQIYKNNNGSFAFSENLSAMADGSIAFGDYDNDGFLDLAMTGISIGGDTTAIYQNDGNGNYTEDSFAALPLRDVDGGSHASWADYNMDGKLDLIIAGTTTSGPNSQVLAWYKNIDTSYVNTIPDSPTGLAHSIIGDTIILSWIAPTNLNPDVIPGLTYNLCIGTSSNNASIISPLSDLSNGFRKVIESGRVGNQLQWKFHNPPNGTYEWSVQAVDQDFEGSLFANKSAFTYTAPAFVNVSEIMLPANISGLSNAFVSMADVNQDNRLELIAIGQTSSSNMAQAYSWQGNGFGPNFLFSVPALRNVAGAWTDFNGDGAIDFVLCGDQNFSGVASPVSHLYLNNGIGQMTLANGRWLDKPNLANASLDWGDFDNDGDADLLISGNLGTTIPDPYTAIFENRNDSLIRRSDLNLPQLLGGTVAWADFDRDGYLDFVISGADGGNNGVTKVYRNLGYLRPGFEEFMGAASIPQLRESRLDWGDCNGDQYPDLLISGANGTTRTEIYRFIPGSNTFAPLQVLDEVKGGTAMLGDYDNDGDMDALITGLDQGNMSQIHLFENDGIGNFTRDDPTSDYLRATSDGSLAWGDFDLDGKLDFIHAGRAGQLSNTRYLTLYKNVDTNPASMPDMVIPQPAVQDADSVILSWNPVATPGVTYNLYIGTNSLGQQIKSSQSDPIIGTRKIVYEGNVGTNTTWVLHNLEEQVYFWNVQAVGPDYEGGMFSTEQSFTYEQPHFLDETVLDFDGDLPAGFDRASLAWGDYDADGDLDLLAMGRLASDSSLTAIYENQDGVLHFRADLSGDLIDLSKGEGAWTDYDRDGDLDLAIAGEDETTLPRAAIYLYNETNDAFEALNISPSGVTEAALAWGDMDNDGDEDLVIAGNSLGGEILEIYINEGLDSLTNYPQPLGEPFRLGDLALADINNDLQLDVIKTGSADGSPILEIYVNKGEVQFDKLDDADLIGLLDSDLAVGDLNHDGWTDILAIGEDSSGAPNTLMLINDSGDFRSESHDLPDVFRGQVELGDYNDDLEGFVDVLISGQNGPSSASRITAVYRNDGNAVFSLDDLASDPLLNVNNRAAMAWGDYDNDGKLDIVLAGRASDIPERSFKLYRNVEGTPNRIPTAPPAPEVEATGIFAQISWDAPMELASAGYTYNLFLKNQDNGRIIIAPKSLIQSGHRQVAGLGNSGQNRSYTILGLEFGNYTCWVQAVAQDLQASLFSDSTNFPFEPTAIADSTGRVFPAGIPGFVDGDVAFADYYGNDEQLDLIVTGRSNTTQNTLLYHNIDGTLVVDPNTSLTLLEQSSVAWGDVNRDGWVDLLHMGHDGNGPRSIILINHEGELIEDAHYSQNLMPLYRGSAAWADLDNDGDLDLVCTGADETDNPSIMVYYNREGQGLEQAGSEFMINLEGVRDSDLALADYDKDGWVDLMICGFSATGELSRIFRNMGDSTFTEFVTPFTDVTDGSVDVGDFNNDGNLDILLTGLGTGGSPVTEIWAYNPDSLRFESLDQAEDLTPISNGIGLWGDYQTDGFLDIMLSGLDENGMPVSRLYQNYNSGGSRRFQEAITSSTELYNLYESAAAWGDYDGDGKLDLAILGDSSLSAEKPVFAMYNNVDTMVNIRPNPPQNLTYNRNLRTLSSFLSWEAPVLHPGQDGSLKDGFTYNLYLVNTGTNDTIFSPMATDNGYRQTVGHGLGRNLTWTIRFLEDGTYDWGIQTVDQDFEGSVWAEGPRFEWENPVPIIIWEDYADYFVDDLDKVESEIGVNSVDIIDSVIIHYKGITEVDTVTNWKRRTLEKADSIFTFDITEDIVDDIGVRYWFEARGISIFHDSSSTGYTYIRRRNGFTVDNLDFGRKILDYNIVSVPLNLTDPSIGSVIEDDFGPYNVRQWRFWRHENGTDIEYTEGLTNVEAGKGYWLITKDERPGGFISGEGTTMEVTETEPYIWRLSQGWNQIGNPYPFNLYWPDIEDENEVESLSRIGFVYLYEDGFKRIEERDRVLPKYSGAFVFAESAVDLKVPVIKNTEFGGREAHGPIGPIDQPIWDVPIRVFAEDLPITEGGIGMHTAADMSKDRFDHMSLPRLASFVDISFHHPEYFYPWFAKDMVKTQDEYIWEFTVENNADLRKITLQWENEHFGYGDKKLILFDVDQQLAVDMAEQNQYLSFSNAEVRPFKIYYGPQSFIDQHIQPDRAHLGQAYPNPFHKSITIPFGLPEYQSTYQVRMSISDMLGKEVRRLLDEERAAGFQSVIWDGKDDNGRRLTSGMYIYKLEIWQGDHWETQTGKMIMH